MRSIELKQTGRLPFYLLAFAICSLADAITLHAQTSRISGTVTDASGALIQHAHITVRDLNTNVITTLETNSDGSYQASALPPDRYSVKAEAVGFRASETTDIALFVDTTARVDLKLAAGSSNENVTVTTDSEMTQPNNAEMATEISTKQYLEYPLEQVGRIRSPASFVYLAPGVQGNLQLNGNEYTGATNVIAVNGSNIWNTELIVDGLPAGQTRIIGNYTESSPAVDAMREFKITTTQLPADYGHTGAAVGSFAVKSGENDFHGTVYEYLRNNVLDSNSWLAKHNGTILSPTRQNEFGATIGGPVLIPHLYNGHGRTFFFFAYGGSRKSGADTYTLSQVPTPAQLQGDFSASTRLIYDPATTKANPSGTGFVRTKFANNKITHFDPIAQQLLGLFPAPNQAAGATQNYGGWTGEKLLNPDTYTVKVDQVVRENHRISATYVRTSIPRINAGGLPAPLATGYYQKVGSHTARIAYNWIVSSNLLNQVTVGFNRFTNFQSPISDVSQFPAAQPLAKIAGGLFPSMTFTNGYATLGSITSQNVNENDYMFRDVLSWGVKKHNLRFGGEFRRAQYNDLAPAQATSTYGFATLETANPQSTGGTGDGFASFLLGQVETASIVNPLPLHTRKNYSGFFVQDDWKVLPHLTLNLGVRYELSGAPTETDDRQSIVDLTAPNPGANNRAGALVFAGAAPLGVGRSNLFDKTTQPSVLASALPIRSVKASSFAVVMACITATSFRIPTWCSLDSKSPVASPRQTTASRQHSFSARGQSVFPPCRT